MPYFSVILPTYNRAHLLPKAIQSMVDQTFGDWELIIVDDGSTDDTKATVEKFQDERIRYIYQENQERSVARNNGINQAKGSYICFLDSDDYFLPEKLETIFSFIQQKNEKKAIFYDGIAFQLDSKTTSVSVPLKKTKETIFEFLLLNPLFSQQICGHHTIFEEYKYNPQFRIGEDIELWCRIAKVYSLNPIVNSNQTVIVEHDERSINPKKTKAAIEHLSTLEFIFSMNSHQDISPYIRSSLKSDSYFNIAKHEMYNSQKFQAITWIIKSVLANRKSDQTKHKIYCLANLFRGQIPKEYKIN